MRAAQLDHAVGHALEEPAIVADRQIARGVLSERRLQPEDALHVEVVGGLVEQQHVGPAGQLADDGEALAPAAGEIVHARVGIREAGSRERHRHAQLRRGRIRRLGVAGLAHRRRHHELDRAVRREARLLRHVAQARLAAKRPRPRVGRLDAGQETQQRGLARAIRPHEADAVPLRQGEREILEEGCGAVRLADALHGEKDRGRHARRLERTRWRDGAGAAMSATLSARRRPLRRASSLSAAFQVRTRRDHASVTGRCERV
jgi:hypothetical protein